MKIDEQRDDQETHATAAIAQPFHRGRAGWETMAASEMRFVQPLKVQHAPQRLWPRTVPSLCPASAAADRLASLPHSDSAGCDLFSKALLMIRSSSVGTPGFRRTTGAGARSRMALKISADCFRGMAACR